MKALRLVAGICYPLVVYAGLTSGGPRVLAVILGVLLAAQGVLSWGRRSRVLAQRFLVPAAGFGGIVLTAWVFDDGHFFLFVPTLVNATLLITFARTLVSGPPMIESFARLRGRELPLEEVGYCRKNTAMWCLFFALNGAVSLWLALNASLEWWVFYTGGLSYLFLGTLFGVELVYRYWRFRPYDGSITDPLFRKIFPPRESI